MKSDQPVESLFPNAAARRAADKVADALPVSLPMSGFLDAWEAAYFAHAGASPFRGKKK